MRQAMHSKAAAGTLTSSPIGLERLYGLTRNVFSVLGLAVIVSLAVPDLRDVVLRSLIWSPWKKDFGNWTLRAAPQNDPWLTSGASPSSSGTRGDERESAAQQAQLTPGLEHASFRNPSFAAREQSAVTSFIAKRYRVADDIIARFVSLAHRAGIDQAVDPLLVLAVMAVESRYNPIAESVMGARGLMQIIPKYHHDKLADLGGADALLDPEVNILVGTRILREYMARMGDTETALQMYAGALDEPTLQYSRKVLAERARLQQVLARTRPEV